MSRLISNNTDTLVDIMKHINKLKHDDDIIDYLYNNYNNNIYTIFNKSDEQIQIDFIKNLLININSKNNFENLFPFLKIQNIYVVKTLLDWGIKINDYSLCYFVLNHKASNINITEEEYQKYEDKTSNKDISLLFNKIRIKETYNDDSNCNSSIHTDDIELTSESDDDYFSSFNNLKTTYESSSEDSISDKSDDSIKKSDIRIVDSDIEEVD